MPALWIAVGLAPAYTSAPVSARMAVKAIALIALCAIAPLSWRYFEAPLLALGRRVRYGGAPPRSQPEVKPVALVRDDLFAGRD